MAEPTPFRALEPPKDVTDALVKVGIGVEATVGDVSRIAYLIYQLPKRERDE